MSEIYKDRIYCLRPGCCRYMQVRGLCRPCYYVAKRLVAEGKASWEKLVKKGLALPAKPTGMPPSEARKCFEEACK